MKRTANKSLRSLVCFLLAALLLFIGFPARAEIELFMTYFDNLPSELGHSSKYTVDYEFGVDLGYPPLWGDISMTLSICNGNNEAGKLYSGLIWPITTDSFEYEGKYGVWTSSINVDSEIFTWTLTVCENSTAIKSFSGTFSIKIKHDYNTWAHDDTTSGADSKHKRSCDCGREEENPCSFTSAVTFPTCTEGGFTTHTCEVCKYNYQDASTTPNGHTWDKWVSNGSGTHIRTCSVCGDTQTSDCAWSAWASNKNGTHSRTCSVCNEKESADCNYTEVETAPTCMSAGYTTYTCSRCGDTYQSDETAALGHDFRRDIARDKAAACTLPGVEAWTCSRCGGHDDKATPALGHLPGEWEVTVPPTNRKTGLQVLRCLRCGVTLEMAEIPLLSETWPDNTACSYGPRFRDEAPELTDKWYMYTPLDLTKEGTLDVPLIASNRYRIGTAQVTVKDGQVYANYQVTADKVQVKEELMTFLPGLDSLVTIELEALASLNIPLDTPVDVASLGGSQALFFMRLVVTYDIYADGVQWWSVP